jgi:hypothetical protein
LFSDDSVQKSNRNAELSSVALAADTHDSTQFVEEAAVQAHPAWKK